MSIYNDNEVEMLLETDSISIEEAGFMNGYLDG